jgi:ornithine carbamoyltransferase
LSPFFQPATTGRSTGLARQSDLETVEAQELRSNPERAPERPAEESVLNIVEGLQVGPDGWFPGQQQPRDAQGLAFLTDFRSARRKEGGTAGADASRPFGPRRMDVVGAKRLVMYESRRESTMQDFSSSKQAATPGIPALHPVPIETVITPDMPATARTVSLGGQTAPKIATFSLSTRLRGRSVLVDTDLTPDEIHELLETAARLKRLHKKNEPHPYLPGKTLGLLFQHPSTRTRVALEAGMAQLGGQAIFLGVNDLQMKRGETIGDTAQILSRYVDALVARVADHNDLETLHASATIPVMNGLSDTSHPLQALADLLTLQERFATLAGLKLAYLGDGNNVVCSLLLSCAAMGISVSVATPEKFQPNPEVVKQATWLGSASGAKITVTDDPIAAAKDADAVYTDVHVSMGQTDGAARAVTLAPYKVTQEIMAMANPSAIFMHCLPMHREEEVTAEVADGPQSIIWDQAENRLHLSKALLLHTMC